MEKLKKLKPELKIGVGGCVASQEGKNIISRAPFVDIVFGPQTIHRVPDLYQSSLVNCNPGIDIEFPKTEENLIIYLLLLLKALLLLFRSWKDAINIALIVLCLTQEDMK